MTDNNQKVTFYKFKHATDDTKEFYIGSTHCLKKRIAQHKTCCTTKPWLKVYTYVNQNGGFENWTFEVIETGEYGNRRAIYEREGELVNIHKPTLNTCVPSGSHVPNYYKLHICGRCGRSIRTSSATKHGIIQHQKTKKCREFKGPVIINGDHNTIHIHY